jgi:hypothetical protein
MVGPAGAPSQNSSNRYPTIRESKVFDARTPSNRVIQNLNPDFNAVWLQMIVELIRCMVPQDTPLIALAQQGAEAACWIVTTKPSAGN